VDGKGAKKEGTEQRRTCQNALTSSFSNAPVILCSVPRLWKSARVFGDAPGRLPYLHLSVLVKSSFPPSFVFFPSLSYHLSLLSEVVVSTD
jgi:hypothetical protein